MPLCIVKHLVTDLHLVVNRHNIGHVCISPEMVPYKYFSLFRSGSVGTVYEHSYISWILIR